MIICGYHCHVCIVCNLPILHWFVQCLVSMVKCVFWNSIYRPPARTHTLALCNPNRFNESDFVYPLSLITHIELPTRLNFINWTRCSCSFRVRVCVCVFGLYLLMYQFAHIVHSTSLPAAISPSRLPCLYHTNTTQCSTTEIYGSPWNVYLINDIITGNSHPFLNVLPLKCNKSQRLSNHLLSSLTKSWGAPNGKRHTQSSDNNKNQCQK